MLTSDEGKRLYADSFESRAKESERRNENVRSSSTELIEEESKRKRVVTAVVPPQQVEDSLITTTTQPRVEIKVDGATIITSKNVLEREPESVWSHKLTESKESSTCVRALMSWETWSVVFEWLLR